VYNPGDTLMSKGLSERQIEVLKALTPNGLDTIDIYKICWKLRYGGQKDPITQLAESMIEQTSQVRDVKNPSSIYRMMRSLEKRGRVVRLLGREPTRWYPTETKESGFTYYREDYYIKSVIKRKGFGEFTNGQYVFKLSREDMDWD